MKLLTIYEQFPRLTFVRQSFLLSPQREQIGNMYANITPFCVKEIDSISETNSNLV